jgi:hypothetical protein
LLAAYEQRVAEVCAVIGEERLENIEVTAF